MPGLWLWARPCVGPLRITATAYFKSCTRHHEAETGCKNLSSRGAARACCLPSPFLLWPCRGAEDAPSQVPWRNARLSLGTAYTVIDLSMTSSRGWGDFLLGRAHFVGRSARQVRASAQNGRHMQACFSGRLRQLLYNVCMHNAATLTALAPRTYLTGW